MQMMPAFLLCLDDENGCSSLWLEVIKMVISYLQVNGIDIVIYVCIKRNWEAHYMFQKPDTDLWCTEAISVMSPGLIAVTWAEWVLWITARCSEFMDLKPPAAYGELWHYYIQCCDYWSLSMDYIAWSRLLITSTIKQKPYFCVMKASLCYHQLPSLPAALIQVSVTRLLVLWATAVTAWGCIS